MDRYTIHTLEAGRARLRAYVDEHGPEIARAGGRGVQLGMPNALRHGAAGARYGGPAADSPSVDLSDLGDGDLERVAAAFGMLDERAGRDGRRQHEVFEASPTFAGLVRWAAAHPGLMRTGIRGSCSGMIGWHAAVTERLERGRDAA